MDGMNRKIVFISGKMTGEPDLGRAKFKKMQDKLEKKGCIVLNPAILPDGLRPDGYLPICMAMIDQADYVVLLDNWQDSKGSTIERLYAKYQGKTIIYPTKKERKTEE